MPDDKLRVHVFQHVPFEGLGSIESRLIAHSLEWSVTRWFAGDTPPEPAAVDQLFVMGGPMGVGDTDRHPWLSEEMRAIERMLSAGAHILGVCLGSQMLAKVLGAAVYPNGEKEIGWFPVRFTDEIRATALFDDFPAMLDVFHWHGDTYDLPAGTVAVGSSEACRNQGFLWNDCALGLQFHLESTPKSAANLVKNCGEELVDAPFIQKPDDIMLSTARFHAVNRVMDGLIDGFIGSAKGNVR